jgi:tRNA A37 threonylcarbamoyltransferase TsaD
MVRLPEKRYCTDNAAMIAFAGLQKGNAGDPRRVAARSRIASYETFPRGCRLNS